jgi:hypothetical protein
MIDAIKRLQRSIRRRLQTPENYRAWRDELALRRWEQAGRPAPPPHGIKVRAVLDHARRFGTSTLVETGTYQGAMIDAVRESFKAVHSIELAEPLYEAAAAKYDGDDAIHIHLGDSGEVLAPLLAAIDAPCLFWLDGHYSEGFTACGTEASPVLRELETIWAHPIRGHVVLIDDARCFTGDDGYPTIAALQALAGERRPEFEFHVADDIIRIHAPEPGAGAPQA